MKYLLVKVWKKVGMRARAGTFEVFDTFDTLEEAQYAREKQEYPNDFQIIQGW
ncbi:MAG TPA: hypothetical protein VGK46_02615 [Saprospiraceae bacterium]